MAAVLALKRRHPEQVLAGLGMHPAWVTRAGEQEVAKGLRWLEANLAKADVLGEVAGGYPHYSPGHHLPAGYPFPS